MRLPGQRQSDGGEPSDRFLLDDGVDTVGIRAKPVNEGLRLGVGRERDGQIRISREPRLGANGDGQAADERTRDVRSREIGVDPA